MARRTHAGFTHSLVHSRQDGQSSAAYDVTRSRALSPTPPPRPSLQARGVPRPKSNAAPSKRGSNRLRSPAAPVRANLYVRPLPPTGSRRVPAPCPPRHGPALTGPPSPSVPSVPFVPSPPQKKSAVLFNHFQAHPRRSRFSIPTGDRIKQRDAETAGPFQPEEPRIPFIRQARVV